MINKAQIPSKPKLRALADKFCNLWKTEEAYENFVQSNRNLSTMPETSDWSSWEYEHEQVT